MRSFYSALVFSLVAAAGVSAHADTVCRDGATTSVEGRGACSHHGGVAKHHSERTSAKKRTESRVERHAEARHDRVRTRSISPDREPRDRDMEREPSWFERHFGHAKEENQPTARCTDGELSYASHHRGACANHGGVAEWLD